MSHIKAMSLKTVGRFEPFIKSICDTMTLHFGDYRSLRALLQSSDDTAITAASGNQVLSKKREVLRQNVKRISYCFPDISGVGSVLQGLPELCGVRQCPRHHRSHVPKEIATDFNPGGRKRWVRIEYDPASSWDQQHGPRLRKLVLKDLKSRKNTNNHPVERRYKLVEKRCFFHALDTRSSPLYLFINELNREWRQQPSEPAVMVCLVCIDWSTDYYWVPVELVDNRLKSN